MYSVHSFWCKKKINFVFTNSIPKKYAKFPRSDITNLFSMLTLNFVNSIPFDHVINKSSKVRHNMIRSCLLNPLTYAPCSDVHLLIPSLIIKLSTLLFHALSSCFNLYNAFIRCTPSFISLLSQNLVVS